MAGSDIVEIVDVIESRKITPSLILMIVLCLIVVTFDGFDAQIMGYVAPAIAKSWHFSPKLIGRIMGPVISSGLFGLMLGALILGTLGDRIGRKSIILVSVVLFGVFSLATSFVTSPAQMLALRFLTGLGLGGAMPGVIALISEFVPKRIRATVVTVVVTGFAVGPALAGFAAGGLIQQHGWPIMFAIGGIVPLLLTPVLWFILPESTRFLARRNAPTPKVIANLRRAYPELSFPADVRFSHTDGMLPKAPVSDIFIDGRASGTLLIWCAIFLNLIGINLQTSWLPTIFTGLGLPISAAVTTTAMLQVGGSTGGFALSWFLHRFDYLKVVIATFVLAAIMVVLTGFALPSTPHQSLTLLRLTVFGAGLFVVGGQSALNALTGLYYPSHIRSTGSGWALGVGRLGAAVGPMVGSALLGMNLGLRNLFYVEAAPFILAAVAISLIGLFRGANPLNAVGANMTTAKAR